MENSPEGASAENPNEDADGTISAATMPGLQKDGEEPTPDVPPLFFLLRDEPWKSIPFIMFNVQFAIDHLMGGSLCRKHNLRRFESTHVCKVGSVAPEGYI